MKILTLSILLTFAPVFGSFAEAATSVDTLRVTNSFDYANDRPVFVRVQVYDHQGLPASNRLIEVFDPAGGDLRIVSGMTDDFGVFEGSVTLPNHLDQVLVRGNVLGIDNEAVVGVQEQSIDQVLR